MIVFVVTFLVFFFGYIGLSAALQYLYFYRQRKSRKQWKIQVDKAIASNDSDSFVLWLPLLKARATETAPHYALFTTLNLFNISLLGAITTQLIFDGRTYTYWNVDDHSLTYFVATFFLPLVWQLVGEYAYHRTMHTPFFFRLFHHYHHLKKSPIVFDDLYLHPVEALLYYSVLFAPPFLGIDLHWCALLVYIIVCGSTGILDHCGIALSFFDIYDTRDHDLHHSQTRPVVNCKRV
jgi:sterol desaturase/sphingolipid hydroxylase (fatty acid hydroxylase superfamily)